MKSRILVTGAGGFIGRHLVPRLLNEGHEVIAMHHYRSGGDASIEGCENKFGDIRDAGYLGGIKCDIVYHLAALIGIPYSYVAPRSYIETNITGALNVLEVFKEKRILITSTSEVYGSSQSELMDESHPIIAQSPYAASKVAADSLSLSYYRSFGTNVTIMRPFNTYGPGQSMRAVIPQIFCQEDPVTLGNVEAIRDFVYVGDTVNAMVYLMDSLAGETYNICTGVGTRIGDIPKMLGKGYKGNDGIRLRPINSEVNRLCGDGSKLAKLGWAPKVSLSEGLALIEHSQVYSYTDSGYTH